jgi:hypothetical protein
MNTYFQETNKANFKDMHVWVSIKTMQTKPKTNKTKNNEKK